MSKFCGNCGKELLETDKFCPNCGTATGVAPVQDNNASQVQTSEVKQVENDPKKYISPEDNKKANKLCWVVLFLQLGVDILVTIIGGFLTSAQIILTKGFLSFLCNISLIAGLGLLIYIRIIYPKNVFSKILIILEIIIGCFIILMYGMALIACGACISTL